MSIPARYDGMCPACRKGWRVGDEIATDDEHRWVHAKCSNLPTWKRPASNDFEKKAVSEEAEHITCPDCGYSRGNHPRGCQAAA